VKAHKRTRTEWRSLTAAPNAAYASHFYGVQADGTCHWRPVADGAPETTPGNKQLRCSVVGAAISNQTLITPKMRKKNTQAHSQFLQRNVVSIACLQSQRATRVASLVAAMSAVMGEGLKPLTTSQTPSENSKSATGSADSPAKGACCPRRPNITAR
jgi:hypothetical protein